MATIVTRETGATAKGSPLTNTELDNNFINLNTELSNVNKRTTVVTSVLNITPDVSTLDVYEITALAGSLEVGIPTGSPVNNQRFLLKIKDDGTSRTITWNAVFRAVEVTLPTSTVASKTLYIGCIYNATDSKWDVLAVGQA
jgi:hypothetical protein